MRYGTESSEINHTFNDHLISDKGGKNIQWLKDRIFNKWYRENWTSTCKGMKLGHYLTLYNKIK